MSLLPPMPTPASDDAVSDMPNIKRRKIRKGTFSCWECKKHKKRCERKPPSSSVCISCQRHGLRCVSQEFADTDESGYEEVGKRIAQVEALVGHFVQRRRSTFPYEEIPEKLSQGHPDTTRLLSAEGINSVRIAPPYLLAGENRISMSASLSGYLHSILPPPAKAALILSRGKFFRLPFQERQQFLKMTPGSSSKDAQQLASVSELPPLTAHPVLLARKLIQIAICLQQLDMSTSEEPELNMDESVCNAARRYVEIASRHVTSQDFLVDSLDGLETIMLEAYYNISLGKLRVAWLLFRRALGIAQLMGLPQMAETEGNRGEAVWFRLVYSDRFLSLMLGLPFAVTDNSFASEHILEANVPSERLERIHVLVVGRIITRNLHMQRRRYCKGSEHNAYDDYKETQDIDYQLKQATRYLPAKWWVIPTLNNAATDVEVTKKTQRLLTQMHQYYLLVILHNPYLIPDPQTTANGAGYSSHLVDCTYSKMAVHFASREVLCRYLVVRNFHRAPIYRGFDDKAFTASIALLLAHIDGHRLGRSNVLEHQRPHDLGIIHNAVDCMEEVSCLDKHVSTSSSPEILKKLLVIEADAANGTNYTAWNEYNSFGKEDTIGKEEYSLQLSIPYFGTINLVRKGLTRPYLANPDSNSVLVPQLTREASNVSENHDLQVPNGGSPFNISSLSNGSICHANL